MIVPFDQYQRYKTLSDLILQYKEKVGVKSFRILEIGANVQKNLEKFLPDEDIYYSDIELPEELVDDSHCFIADATNLVGIEDDTYDMVVASDVFEHIPSQLRQAFLSEINRVAKHAAIICFPFNEKHVSDAEVRVDEYFRAICGEEYRWLREHIQNGLPAKAEVNRMLDEMHLQYKEFEHGDIKTWETMTKNHMYACFAQDLIEYREQIDKFYNEQIYSNDIGECNYRVFYMMYKDANNASLVEQVVENIHLGSEIEVDQIQKLNRLSHELIDINELKLRLKVNEIAGEVKKKDSFTKTSLQENAFSIFYDYGNGITEENKVMKQDQNYITMDEACIKVMIPEGVKNVRIDPIEGKKCILSNFKLYANGQKITSYETNGICMDSLIVFNGVDPNVTLQIHSDVKELVICSDVYVIDNMIGSCLINEIELLNNQNRTKINQIENEKNQEIERLKSENFALQSEIQNYKQLHETVNNTISWKITKPLRVASRGAKKVVKKTKHVKKVGKVVRSCKQHGVKYTLSLVKTALKTNSATGNIDYLQHESLPAIDEDIKFSILVPIYNPDCKYLKILIDSIKAQNYSNWELCLADGSNQNQEEIRSVCEAYVAGDSRIKYSVLEENLGISGNTNNCAKMATGDYFVLSDQDDFIHPYALYYNAVAIYETNADVLYSDENHVTTEEEYVNTFYKPDWSIDLLYNQMYICHLFVFRRSLFEKVNGFRSEFDGSQDYDLMLRFSEHTDQICHIPKVLYSWRETETSTAMNPDSKPYAHYAGQAALEDHLKRKYGEAAHAEFTDHTFVFEPRFDYMTEDTKVSIIIPMKDKWDLTNDCIQSIFEKTTHQNYEILVLDNRSEQAETFAWFEKIQKQDSRVRVIKADFEFNWSKLNNFGVKHATGDIFVFLNNDIVIISEDWLNRLGELTLREDVGVVGPMLLFEDNTIQHAGIVVGFGGWADHVFKAMQPVHYTTPFVSSAVSRNVLAVTGACLCISREKFEIVGDFDEEFIICGSDVELCVRAYQKGFNNIYDAYVRLYHLESKSRDSYIPEIDFKKSYECYGPYRENGDPYYNANLDINSTTPKEGAIPMDIEKFKRHLKNNRFTAPVYKKVKQTVVNSTVNYEVQEVLPIPCRETDVKKNDLRLNIIVPSLNKEHVFGGIATALNFYKALGESLGCDVRAIITDSNYDANNAVAMEGFVVCKSDEDSNATKQIVPFGDRYNKTIPVRANDIFMATGWWTAYTIADVVRWQNKKYQLDNPLIYFIQDYEPGFYPWSSRYLMADSTYKLDIKTIAIFNSNELKDHFDRNGYSFYQEYCFKPSLNEELASYLQQLKGKVERKKQILIYGRPSTQRNAFELLLASLKEWSMLQPDASEWEVISLGEQFADIPLANGVVVRPLGKVSLEEYATKMLETKVGISLMVSPHPSYPPLEMSTFGIKTITNCYGYKDLSTFNENIISLKDCSQSAIARKLVELCSSDLDNKVIDDTQYCKHNNDLEVIISDLTKLFN